MNIKKFIFSALILSPVIASASTTTEMTERGVIEQQVMDLTYKKDWVQLESIIKQYNTNFPATSGGTQKLEIFWGSMYDIYKNDVSDGGFTDETINEWLKAVPNSSGARILKAFKYNAQIVELRGEGPADSVDPSVWPKYKKLVNQQKEYLLKNKDLADKDAEWYPIMMMVARNLEDKDLLYKTFYEGIEKYPTYQDNYLQAMEGRLPKWGGSYEEIEKIARIAADKNKTQSGLSMYAYIWHNAFFFQPDSMNLLRNKKIVSWNDLLQGWRDRYVQYHSTRTLNGVLIASCIADDKETFTRANAMIDGQVERQSWPMGVTWQQCKDYFKQQN
ncbi:DUF4034 domain-containing protein [Pseudocitrobacter sp. 73]|uniref:DUF4034 domain-containing protein n=1 Tax=Pseudocitrobacter sp. 73 TaxID=2605731 RepID=UPI0011ECF9B8|nr:DUF4034 domain-containing protein [Pseudocitrobacter sp. 73]KAA1050257.1 DUF4034 domain-containing protein [Pseudocitrobacter sp. 73]